MTKTILLNTLIIAVLVQGAAQANSGLSERPVNLSCVAPEQPSSTLVLVPVARAQVPEAVVRSPRSYFVQGAAPLEIDYTGSEITMAVSGRLRYDRRAAELGLVTAGRHGADVITSLLLDLPPVLRWVEDRHGELWLETPAGSFFRLEEQLPENVDFPQLLSETGCFQPGIPTTPAAGLIPYKPSSPLWSDGATKRRWLAMPDWLQPGTTIALDADGDFIFPPGTVLVKEFSLGDTLVETRLLISHTDGEWAGYTYEWNAAQTDAVLLPGGKTTDINGQTWQFPSRGQCTYCHAAAAGRSIGPEVGQLNNDMLYPGSGVVANQLTTLESVGLLSAALPAPVNELPALVDPKGPQGTIDKRARAYLHANCGYCHRPGGFGLGPEDFRYWVPGQDIGAYNVAPTRGNLGISDALLLYPGEPDKSILSIRMQVLDQYRMPIIGSLSVDTEAIAVINEWIDSGQGFGIADADGDGLADNVDNCRNVDNAGQIDSDGDGFGNVCDPDLNNDNLINFLDLGLLKARFFTNDADADFNGDGNVNFLDLAVMKAMFFSAPGPGALAD